MQKIINPAKIIVSSSPEETIKLGETFVKDLKKNNTLAFYGDLGSGKTTFIQGLARGFGIKKRIISPTFIILRSYKVKSQKPKAKRIIQNFKYFYHVDLYRINSLKDIESLGLEELIKDNKNIVAIEWAEKIKDLLPKQRTEIYFKYLSENKRRIKIIHRNKY